MLFRSLQYEPHKGIQQLVKALNQLYRKERALYHDGFSPDGFEWINADDIEHSVYVYARKSDQPKDTLIVVLNVTPVYRENYRVGVPHKSKWKEIFNTDDQAFYGSGKLNTSILKSESIESNGQKQSILIDIPPLGLSILKKTGK